MFKSAIKYSYVNSKIRGLHNFLLSSDQFSQLAGTDNYNNFVDKLQKTPYSMFIQQYSDESTLIKGIYKSLFESYEKLISSLKGAEKDLLTILYSKYEMQNLKININKLCGKGSNALLFPISKGIFCNREYSTEGDDLRDLIDSLYNTPYYHPLDFAYHRFLKEKKTFALEKSLDIDFYHRLWEKVISLGYRDRAIAKKLIGIELDAINIFWIAKFKFDYNLLPEQILNYTLMHGYSFELKNRRNFAKCNSFEEILDKIPSMPYGKQLQDVENPEEMFAHMLLYKKKLSLKYWRSIPFQIGTILCYIFMKEMEIRDLIALMDIKKNELSIEEYKKYTVHGLE